MVSVLYFQVNAYNAKRQLAVNNVARAYGASDGTAFAYGVPGANNVAYKGAGYGNPGGSFYTIIVFCYIKEAGKRGLIKKCSVRVMGPSLGSKIDQIFSILDNFPR